MSSATASASSASEFTPLFPAPALGRSCYSFGVGAPGRYRRSLLAAVLALGVAACGYRVVGRSTEGSGTRRVSIETFTNESMEPGVEFLVADSLRRELLGRGGYRLVTDLGSADVVIRGAVRPIATRSQSISSIVLAIEHTLTLTLDVRFDTPGGGQRGGAGVFRESELYLASADVEVARTHREEALRRLVAILAIRVQDALEAELRP